MKSTAAPILIVGVAVIVSFIASGGSLVTNSEAIRSPSTTAFTASA